MWDLWFGMSHVLDLTFWGEDDAQNKVSVERLPTWHLERGWQCSAPQRESRDKSVESKDNKLPI